MLSETNECSISIHEMSWRIYFLRSACTISARLLLRFKNKIIARGILSMYSPINIQGYDLIIAAGGNTMAISAAIKISLFYSSYSTRLSKRAPFINV